MARLDSEEKERPSSINLIPLELFKVESGMQDEIWQKLKLELRSGDSLIQSENSDNCSLCRNPADELESLCCQLDELLQGKKQRVVFEPSEPSFELSMERSRREGIKVEAWIDSGNAKTGFYTWDAAGVRFFTTDEHLAEFINELRRDFLLSEPLVTASKVLESSSECS